MTLMHQKTSYHTLCKLLVFFIWTSSHTAHGQNETEETKPNIVIILVDDLGWNDVGFHNPEMRTPHLNQLADQGIALERFYVGALCSPTRAGLMTGKYPDRFGLRNVVGPRALGGLPTEERTLANLLADAGYKNRGAFGKWHLGHSDVKYHPMRRGFTTFYGHYNGAIDYFTHFRDGAHDWHEDYKNSTDTGYSVDLVAKQVVEFIEKSDEEPFFAYVALNAPHTPLQAKEEDLKKHGFDSAKLMKDFEAGGAQMGEFNSPDYGQKGRGNTARQTYAAMVTGMDRAIGKIMEAINNQGLAENTVIWFLSDNGGDIDYGGSNLPLRGEKATEWEGGVRSVSLVYWKGKWGGGKTNDQVMGYIDMYPTIANVVGAEKPAVDGINLTAALAGKTLPTRTFFLGREAVVEKQWKLNNGQLFNLDKDPSEENDVAASHPTILAKMEKALKDYQKIVKPLSLEFHPLDWKPPVNWKIAESASQE